MLNAGIRLGPYEILTVLGAGGMGEVYRARDPRLDRTVAIKVLPEVLAADAQFRARFDREARTLSQLNHPHICTLYDVGEHEGTRFLVVEFLEGETLAARLERGRLNVHNALKIAIEVTSALDAAHRAELVHRDLKPGNVMLTRSARSGGPSGPPIAKLLDFGLAKTTSGVGRALRPAAGGSAGAKDAVDSAIPTTRAALTAQGTILGTFQYMAPEQLEGQEADGRTDIFAFGCVLYEMLTGRKAFEGKTQVSLIAAIIGSDPPPVSQVQQLAPPALDRLVRTCLAKDPEDRWQTARDLLRELTWIAESTRAGASTSTASASPQAWPVRQAWLAWALAAAASVGLGALALRQTRGPVQPPSLARVMITLPAGQAIEKGRFSPVALSPDGRLLVYAAAVRGGQTQLYLRALDELEARPIPATEGATAPFFSSDGRWLAFYAEGSLKFTLKGR